MIKAMKIASIIIIVLAIIVSFSGMSDSLEPLYKSQRQLEKTWKETHLDEFSGTHIREGCSTCDYFREQEKIITDARTHLWIGFLKDILVAAAACGALFGVACVMDDLACLQDTIVEMHRNDKNRSALKTEAAKERGNGGSRLQQICGF